MRIVQPTPAQLASAAAFAVPADIGVPADEVNKEIEAGRLRPEWSVVALDESGVVVGRALWRGRDPAGPIALDVWDVAADVAGRELVATNLLRAGHEALSRCGVTVPLPHSMRLPHDWRVRPTVAIEVELTIRAAAAAGMTRTNERLQFQWDAGGPLPPGRGPLVFTPADDDTFAGIFAAAAEGLLDVMTRRELESAGPDALARAELDYYRACPGERSWWRTAATPDGTVVGVAIPSATPTNCNVGYLAVLPEHRGRGTSTTSSPSSPGTAPSRAPSASPRRRTS